MAKSVLSILQGHSPPNLSNAALIFTLESTIQSAQQAMGSLMDSTGVLGLWTTPSANRVIQLCLAKVNSQQTLR